MTIVSSPTHALRSAVQSHVRYHAPSRIITVPASAALTEFSSLGELLVGFLDCMVAHLDAVEAADVLHCDVSLTNLLLSPQNGHRNNHGRFMENLSAQQKEYLSKRIDSLARRGVLADWGVAVPIAPSRSPPVPATVDNPERHPSARHVAASVTLSPTSATVNNSDVVDDSFNPTTPPTEPADIPDYKTRSVIHVTVMGKGLADLARDSNTEDDRRRTTVTAPLVYRTGAWSWMSVEFLMAKPTWSVVHEPRHDLESFFYILVGICVLLDEPFKLKSEDELSSCFDEYFDTPEPSVYKAAITQSDIGWTGVILLHISQYFEPLIPLLNHLRKEIMLPLHGNKGGSLYRTRPLVQKSLIEAIIMALHDLPNDAWEPYQDPNTGNGNHPSRPGNEANGSDESELESARKSIQEDKRMSQTKGSAVSLPTKFITSDSGDHYQPCSMLVVPLNSSGVLANDDPLILPRNFVRGGTGFRIIDTYMEGASRRRTRDDASDDHSPPRPKRARGSSKNQLAAGS
ncbi:hypothetical protein EDD15DRAFT_2370985 [Pisolithus albus]|nr:hypothetical protein EDD15DRAFT_2370985 [Pisolithus albus]